jgi:hypothetical protein
LKKVFKIEIVKDFIHKIKKIPKVMLAHPIRTIMPTMLLMKKKEKIDMNLLE